MDRVPDFESVDWEFESLRRRLETGIALIVSVFLFMWIDGGEKRKTQLLLRWLARASLLPSIL